VAVAEGETDEETVAEALVERVGTAVTEPDVDEVAEGVGAVECEASDEGDAVAESEGDEQPAEAETKVVPAGQGVQAVVAPARLKVKGGQGAHRRFAEVKIVLPADVPEAALAMRRAPSRDMATVVKVNQVGAPTA
jgi:hypothetical protein